MRSETQIGGWLRPDEHADFMSYLDQFCLRQAPVATLLIVRELRCARLPDLARSYGHSSGSGRKRITAGPTSSALKRAFENHAARWGLDPDPAAAMIYRAELQERWLQRAIELEST